MECVKVVVLIEGLNLSISLLTSSTAFEIKHSLRMVLENGRMQRLMLYLNLFAKCCVGWWLDDVPLVFCRTLPPEIGVTCDISKLRKLRFMHQDRSSDCYQPNCISICMLPFVY